MKTWKTALLVTFSVGILLLLILFHWVFIIPERAELLLPNSTNSPVVKQCYQNPNPIAVDDNGKIDLLVWNIYKQNRDNWQSAIDRYSQKRQLMLLQEVSLTDEFTQWIAKKSWGSNYVNAFKAFDVSSGVLNLATQMPSKACAYVQVEPWLRLPKSALYASYPLTDGQNLAVINIHAINFTFGVEDYQHQIEHLSNVVMQHQGPLIVAGDFNSWSPQRMNKLHQLTNSLNLQEVYFSPDHRKRFITGLALDHVFIRDLDVINAKAPMTDASDHNPLLISLKISGYTKPK